MASAETYCKQPLAVNTKALEFLQDRHVNVEVSRRGQCSRLSIFVVCLMLSLFVFVWLLSIVITQWQEQASHRLWLVLGLMSYASGLVYKGWGMLLQFGEEVLFMQVTIKSTRASTLYHAVCEHVAFIAAGADGASVSRDMVAGLDYDATVGRSTVKLHFWGRRGKTVRLSISQAGRQMKMTVTQMHNADILTGRDHQPTADDCLLLRLRSSDSSLALDASLVQNWLQICVDEYLKQPKDQVQVYQPLRRWREQEPEWSLYRTQPAPSASTTGPMSYIPRKSLHPILVDVTHRHTSLRVYFVHGATGTGKSHFAVWLASQLGMPIYNISLTSPMVQGDSLLRLFSESALKHWPCLVHIDEFDAAVEMWKAPKTPAYGVSLETFKELLDGSASMSSGIIVITAMTEKSLSNLPVEESGQILRRMHKIACINAFTVQELQAYVSQYIAFFLEPTEESADSSPHLELFAKAFVRCMDDKAVHAVKKALEEFLTQALEQGRMFRRESPYPQRSMTAVDTTMNQVVRTSMRLSDHYVMYTDIRDYFLPLKVLQEYAAAHELDTFGSQHRMEVKVDRRRSRSRNRRAG